MEERDEREHGLLYALSAGRCRPCELEGKIWTPSETLGLQKQHIIPETMWNAPTEVLQASATHELKSCIHCVLDEKSFDGTPKTWKRLCQDIRMQVVVCPGHNFPVDQGLVTAWRETKNRRGDWAPKVIARWMVKRIKQMAEWRNALDEHGCLDGLSNLSGETLDCYAKEMCPISSSIRKALDESPTQGGLRLPFPAFETSVKDADPARFRHVRAILRGRILWYVTKEMGRMFGARIVAATTPDEGLQQHMNRVQLELCEFACTEHVLHVEMLRRSAVGPDRYFGLPNRTEDHRLYERLSRVFSESLKLTCQPAIVPWLEEPEWIRHEVHETLELIYKLLSADPAGKGGASLIEQLTNCSCKSIDDVFKKIGSNMRMC